jgi:hypothetical protein
MTDINIKSTHYTEEFPVRPLTINPLTINPLTIAGVHSIAPVAVHLKELNQIAPLLVESLRVDHVRHIDPLRIDRLNITQLPSVNLSLSQLPSLDINVRRVPPVAISLQQELELKSCYTMRARLLGLEVMRMEIEGKTKVAPRDCARREQSRSHERSFPDVAAAGNPAIPVRAIETCGWTERRGGQPPPPAASRHAISAGAPRFNYSLRHATESATRRRPSTGNAVSFGG